MLGFDTFSQLCKELRKGILLADNALDSALQESNEELRESYNRAHGTKFTYEEVKSLLDVDNILAGIKAAKPKMPASNDQGKQS